MISNASGDDIEFVLTDDGVLTRGLKSIPADQAWFWGQEWQAGECKASEQVAEGGGTIFRRAVSAFVEDLSAGRPFRGGLRVKRVQAAPGVREVAVAPDGRATWQHGAEVRPGETHVVWRRIGTHAVFDRP